MTTSASGSTNPFLAKITEASRLQLGIFTCFGDPVAAEITAGAGFDWVLIDCEHAANDSRGVLLQLQAIGNTPAHALVRPAAGTTSALKPLLDAGARTFLIPMVESADDAAKAVAAVRYPTGGTRGVATTRASRWGRDTGHFGNADSAICVIAQIESQAGLDQLEQIAAVDGIDALFVGPSDLAASIGHLGAPGRPEVRDTVVDAIERIRRVGLPAGVFAVSVDAARPYIEAGASFLSTALDTTVFARATEQVAATFAAAFITDGTALAPTTAAPVAD